jgi:hypothetical protein
MTCAASPTRFPEHADAPVLDEAGALTGLYVAAGLPFEDDACDARLPQQRRRGQPGHSTADNRHRRGFPHHLRRNIVIHRIVGRPERKRFNLP